MTLKPLAKNSHILGVQRRRVLETDTLVLHKVQLVDYMVNGLYESTDLTLIEPLKPPIAYTWLFRTPDLRDISASAAVAAILTTCWSGSRSTPSPGWPARSDRRSPADTSGGSAARALGTAGWTAPGVAVLYISGTSWFLSTGLCTWCCSSGSGTGPRSAPTRPEGSAGNARFVRVLVNTGHVRRAGTGSTPSGTRALPLLPRARVDVVTGDQFHQSVGR